MKITVADSDLTWDGDQSKHSDEAPTFWGYSVRGVDLREGVRRV